MGWRCKIIQILFFLLFLLALFPVTTDALTLEEGLKR